MIVVRGDACFANLCAATRLPHVSCWMAVCGGGTVTGMDANSFTVSRGGTICAYCTIRPGVEREHVIARQFFPPDERWRGNLPIVPSCRECNGDKQRVEDIVGVYMQFGDASEGAGRVLVERVPRTLAKNRPLTDSLRKGYLGKVLLRKESGVLIPAVAIELNDEHLRAADRWYRFTLRGLYRYETGEPLPLDHAICLIKPRTAEQYAYLRDMILADPTHQRRSVAAGEFRYIYATSRLDPVSMWLIAFRSVEMAAVTLGPGCPDELRAFADEIGWRPPPPDANTSGSR